MQTNRKPNRLIDEKSPYLLQHAYHPVDWLPWNEDAFAIAKREDKPIFLSIGYSTCHWCHVMARESFEDEEVARVLNKHFVPVKVDREERPDIDHIYMTVCQAMTGQGGWPLTIIMTAEQEPFYAGTYLPKRSQWGRPGLLDLLDRVHRLWQNEREKLTQTGRQVTTALQQYMNKPQPTTTAQLSADDLLAGVKQLQNSFDKTYGGFGEAPKFPTPHNYLFLLREWYRDGRPETLQMVEHSLKCMHQGGIYDHLGFGFARYSVDNEWLVPHFEKMLYDNALLAMTYIETYQATQNEYYARIAQEIFQYIDRVMTSPEGGFYSAEDADSEGEEGKFYVWEKDEIEEVLNKAEAGDSNAEKSQADDAELFLDDAQLFCEVYNVTHQGHFEGKNILNLIQRDFKSIAQKYGLTEDALREKLSRLREKLFAHREQRVHPHKDDKILTSWNGLMIAALAKGAAALQQPRYLLMAEQAVQMIEDKLVDKQGRLLARYREGEAHFPAYVDDYAFFIWGLHELYQASGKPNYLTRAEELTNDALSLFWDEQGTGFFFYGHDAEKLLIRPKEMYDGALPSGNGVLSYNLVRHSRLTGKMDYQRYAEKLLHAYAEDISQNPAAHTFFLISLQMLINGSEMVIVEGRNEDVYAQMVQKTQQTYLPLSVYILKSKEHDVLDAIVPVHRDKKPRQGQTTFYRCANFACQQPVFTVRDVQQSLSTDMFSRG